MLTFHFRAILVKKPKPLQNRRESVTTPGVSCEPLCSPESPEPEPHTLDYQILSRRQERYDIEECNGKGNRKMEGEVQPKVLHCPAAPTQHFAQNVNLSKGPLQYFQQPTSLGSDPGTGTDTRRTISTKLCSTMPKKELSQDQDRKQPKTKTNPTSNSDELEEMCKTLERCQLED